MFVDFYILDNIHNKLTFNNYELFISFKLNTFRYKMYCYLVNSNKYVQKLNILKFNICQEGYIFA